MKLEVGMHIRINGFISKIGHINTSKKGNTYIQFKQPNGLLITMNTKFLDDEKASHNILELIEVGDYVNGYPVESMFGSNGVVLDINYQKNAIPQIVNQEEIKSIVTKEQFESIKYSLEG